MLQYIFASVFVLALGTIVVLFARANARVPKMEGKRGMIERWVTSEFPEKLDRMFNSALLKWLRKFKVFVLRVDNSINKRMQSVRSDTNGGNGNGKGDFEELKEKVQEDDRRDEEEPREEGGDEAVAEMAEERHNN